MLSNAVSPVTIISPNVKVKLLKDSLKLQLKVFFLMYEAKGFLYACLQT